MRHQEYFDCLLAIAHEPLILLDDEFRILGVSEAFSRHFSLPAGSAIGRQLSQLAGGLWNLPELNRLLTTTRHFDGESGRATLEADLGAGVRTLVVHARSFTEENAGPFILLAIDDATDRLETEARCAYLSAVVFSSADAILSWDLDGRVTDWNEGACGLYGYGASEMSGQSLARLLTDDRPGELPDLLGRVRRGEHLDRIQAVRRRKDGSLVHVALSVSPMRDTSGEIAGATSIERDVSAQVAAEEALRQTLSYLNAILDNAPMLLWTLDEQGCLTAVEGRLLKRLNLHSEDLVGRSIFDLYREHREIVDTARRVLAGDPVHVPLQLGDAALEVWYVPVKNAEGTTTGATGLALDVTERARLEEQFRQAQKMEAVGRLAGGIAHDFNNLLTAILGYAELVAAQVPPSSDLASDISSIRKAGLSASSLTRQLLAFSRRQILKPEIISINDVVERTGELLRGVAGEPITLTLRLDPQLWHTSADPGQIEQVIVNLAMNASDAMPAGGELTLETGNITVDPPLAARIGARTGPHVFLRVSDTGVGMDDALKRQIFEPFFTTKEKARGSGLGLSTVYGIVQQSGGHIAVDSQPGRGTSFTVYLPADEAPLSAQRGAGTRAAAGGETILLVEDQEDVRGVASAILRHGGYTVVEAAQPEEALALIEERGGTFDLLLTDVVMPQMSGRDLARLVAERLPHLKILYTSGYAEDAIVEHGVLEPGLAFVPKPFTPKALLQAVRGELDRVTS